MDMKKEFKTEFIDKCSESEIKRTQEFRDLEKINKLLRTSKNVIKIIKKELEKSNNNSFSLLDVGCGSGDVSLEIAKWARKNNYKAKIEIIDINPLAINLAKQKTKNFSEINVGKKDILKNEFKKYDFVLLLFTLHHFKEENIIKLLKKLSNISKSKVIIEDFIRDFLSYYFIKITNPLLSFLISKQSKKDALQSVKNSYTIKEIGHFLRLADIKKYKIKRRLLFHKFNLRIHKN